MPARADYTFASDNTAGICPEAWAGLIRALMLLGRDEDAQKAYRFLREEVPDFKVRPAWLRLTIF